MDKRLKDLSTEEIILFINNDSETITPDARDFTRAVTSSDTEEILIYKLKKCSLFEYSLCYF